MAADERVLAFAVTANACLVIAMEGDELLYWVQLRESPNDTSKVRSYFRLLVACFEPAVLLHEDPGLRCRKHGKNLVLLQLLAQAAADESVRSMRMVRKHDYPDRYEEAVALSERYPDFARWLPETWSPAKRASRSMAYFEALSYVCAYRQHEAKRQ